MTNDDYLFFKNTFSNAGALDRIVSFINTTEDPSVERILIPDMALSAAEYFAVQKNEKVCKTRSCGDKRVCGGRVSGERRFDR